MTHRIVVVGGGIVGLATAWKIGKRFPNAQVTVLEKESEVGRHQSSHNSGVLHAGLYYKPGSSKARLAVSGIRMMTEFCRQHSIAHEICGKVVVAVTENEVPRLKTLFERGQQNGLTGLRWLSSPELKEREPHVSGVAAVLVPEEGIADYPAVCRALVWEIKAQGGEVVCDANVRSIHGKQNDWRLETAKGNYQATYIVTCAGLHSDRVAALTGQPREIRILPFRGEYYGLRKDKQHLCRHLIYPVPDPAFPFLGVHFTRGVHGGVEAGPNAVLALSREGYGWRDWRVKDVADALAFSGLWNFLGQHAATSWREVQRSLSKELFCATLQRLVPELQLQDLVTGGSGVRAQAITPAGKLVEDFAFQEGPGQIHLINAPSPGATASLAIGEEIAKKLLL